MNDCFLHPNITVQLYITHTYMHEYIHTYTYIHTHTYAQIMGNSVVMKLPRVGVLCHAPTLSLFKEFFPAVRAMGEIFMDSVYKSNRIYISICHPCIHVVCVCA